MTSKSTNKFSPEVRARATRMVLDYESEHPPRWAAARTTRYPGYDVRLPPRYGSSRRRHWRGAIQFGPSIHVKDLPAASLSPTRFLGPGKACCKRS
jgi:hypothetical protein